MKFTKIAAVTACLALVLAAAPNAFGSRYHVMHHVRNGMHRAGHHTRYAAHHMRVKMHHGHRHMHNMLYHGHM